jgi:hypothetical protein
MRAFVVAATLLATAVSAHAQTSVSGRIQMIRTGWNTDQFAVVLVGDNGPNNNPHGCHNFAPDSGYLVTSAQPGYQTYYAIALNAASRGAVVTVVIDNQACIGDWKKLIGINVP